MFLGLQKFAALNLELVSFVTELLFTDEEGVLLSTSRLLPFSDNSRLSLESSVFKLGIEP